jgi:hypothetical protein
MEKCMKLLIMLSAAAALAYAQPADSMSKPKASPAAIATPVTGITIVSNNAKKFIAHTAPTTKTNWSKVKDLFL